MNTHHKLSLLLLLFSGIATTQSAWGAEGSNSSTSSGSSSSTETNILITGEEDLKIDADKDADKYEIYEQPEGSGCQAKLQPITMTITPQPSQSYGHAVMLHAQQVLKSEGREVFMVNKKNPKAEAALRAKEEAEKRKQGEMQFERVRLAAEEQSAQAAERSYLFVNLAELAANGYQLLGKKPAKNDYDRDVIYNISMSEKRDDISGNKYQRLNLTGDVSKSGSYTMRSRLKTAESVMGYGSCLSAVGATALYFWPDLLPTHTYGTPADMCKNLALASVAFFIGRQVAAAICDSQYDLTKGKLWRMSDEGVIRRPNGQIQTVRDSLYRHDINLITMPSTVYGKVCQWKNEAEKNAALADPTLVLVTASPEVQKALKVHFKSSLTCGS